MASSKDKTVPVQTGPINKQVGKTNANMKKLGRNLSKVAAQKRGG